jgi:hypothetical protein
MAIFRTGLAAFLGLIAAAFVIGSSSLILAAVDKPEPLLLKCVGEIAFGAGLPARGAALSFETSVPFGEGAFIGLSDPETGKIQTPLYDMEVLTGSFRIDQETSQAIVWTRATGQKGWFVGQVIGSDGELFSLTIRSPPAGSTERPFVLFSTAAASAYRGTCV